MTGLTWAALLALWAALNLTAAALGAALGTRLARRPKK